MAKGGPDAIFRETQVFEQAAFNYQTKTFEALGTHVHSGDLQLVITDITVREVHAHIANAVANELARHREFRRHARVLKQAKGSGIESALAEQDRSAIIEQLQKAFDGYLSDNDAEIIDTSTVLAGPVLVKYFTQAAPFGSGDKRREFPDAFVIEALAGWAKKYRGGVFVVSG